MEAISNGSTYTLKADPERPALSAHLKRNGWDGLTYTGVSRPTGRRRCAYRGMFYRNGTTGEFVIVCRVRDTQQVAA